MQDNELSVKEVAAFEQLAAVPKTAEVMTELSQNLVFNFERPARAFLEVAARQLGLDYFQMDRFHDWWTFDRVPA